MQMWVTIFAAKKFPKLVERRRGGAWWTLGSNIPRVHTGYACGPKAGVWGCLH